MAKALSEAADWFTLVTLTLWPCRDRIELIQTVVFRRPLGRQSNKEMVQAILPRFTGLHLRQEM